MNQYVSRGSNNINRSIKGMNASWKIPEKMYMAKKRAKGLIVSKPRRV